MNKWRHDLSLRTVKLLNVMLVTFPFGICWFCYYASGTAIELNVWSRWLVVLLFAVLYFTFGRVYEAFQISYARISDMIYSQALAMIMADSFTYVVMWILTMRFPNIFPALLALAAQMVIVVAWSMAAHNWYFSTFPAKESAVVYDTREGLEKLIDEYGLEKKFRVRWTSSVHDCLDNLQALNGLDTVFLSGVHSHDRNILIKYCIEHGVTALIIPRVGDVIMSAAKKVHLFHLPMLRVQRYNPAPEFLFVKRAFDVIVSGLITVIVSPVMAIIAIVIKMTDGGPILYKQKRLTKDGKVFEVLKFRSMRVDAEKDGVARLSTGENDDRITPVGRVIRACRMDELPQLFNILKGDMSIVGPRPERPEIAAYYEEEMPEFKLRLQAKAGLTGYAQVYGKYNTTPYDKLQMDLMYIANPGVWQDLHIMFSTVKILFMKESTEGVEEGQTTAMGDVVQMSTENDVGIRQNAQETERLTRTGT